MKRITAVAVLFIVVSVAQAACDLGVVSSFVNANGVELGKYHEPAVQGGCTGALPYGFFVGGWGSLSTREPGLNHGPVNEFDLFGGWDGPIAGKWSANIYAAYYDIANPRLLSANGDLLKAGATFRYAWSPTTSLYWLVEGLHGIGSRALPGGWKGGIGVRSVVGPATVDATLMHNHNFLGNGQFSRITIEPTKAIAKFAGGEVRPSLTWVQTYGSYHTGRGDHLVAGIRVNWP